MAQTKKLHFIVIDDSKLDCFIAEKVIKSTWGSESIKLFLQAKDAFEYISAAPVDDQVNTVIFVDIQMPVMNGFQFIEAFEKLPSDITAHYTIYVISSTINENDLEKVRNFASVKQFLKKPITGNNLSILLT